ncbi:MAG: YHS domain-containing (seleno)protein [Saprospiraceae bacterium]|nr:YHS domain-containing (seleno)protein [Saprospiraceae bacterium]
MKQFLPVTGAFIFLMLSGFGAASFAQNPETARQSHFRLGKNNLAIDGYDPVSYYQDGPKKGSSRIAYTYNGIVYRFATVANMETFKADPARYEPAWGGWCGHAMAVRGDKVTINPLTYKIVNGRNFLFYNKGKANALVNWEKELTKTPENRLVEQGDTYWQNILTH